MIYLWHSEEGVPFHRDQESQTDLGEKLRVAIATRAPELLRPGERRFLSSGFSGERFFQHTVQVTGSGQQAIFQVLGIRFEVTFLGGNPVLVPEKGTANFRRVVLPDQRPFMLVAFPDKEPGLIRIVDLVYYYQPVASSKAHVQFQFSRN